MRKIEAARDAIMHGVGTDEPWHQEMMPITVQYRKPLRIDEVNQMASTREVRARPERP